MATTCLEAETCAEFYCWPFYQCQLYYCHMQSHDSQMRKRTVTPIYINLEHLLYFLVHLMSMALLKQEYKVIYLDSAIQSWEHA